MLKFRINYKNEGDGFLVETICCPEFGYLYCSVFRGDNKKKWGFEKSPSGEELSITERRVLYLVNKYLKKGNREPSKYHHLFHDNLYSSKKYFETLWTRCRIYATGITQKQSTQGVNCAKQ